MSAFTPAMKSFINAERFAVIGRVLTDRTRWDNKVLRWYQAHDLPVTPVKPGGGSGESVEDVQILSEPTALPDLPSTSISVIIHPSLGLGILKSLYPTPPAPAEPRGIWFQPGAESDEIRAYAKQRGIEDRVVAGGQCILKQGDALMGERKVGAKM
ncbi:hypothetical protein JCM24511_08246 [Saitozyma sp. JCM 24511]|nr:hypothetical protein JCM24511_08246 [Saitozyma sp. JCM 24511]